MLQRLLRSGAGVSCRSRWAAGLLILATLMVPATTAARQAPAPSSPDYSSVARGVVSALAAREFDRVFAQFNDSKSATLSPTSIGNAWDRVVAESGTFQRIESVEVADRNYHVATIVCAFEKGSRTITIYLDDAGRIAGLRLNPPVLAGTGAPWTPPTYANPSTFHEVPLVVADGSWQLQGTLTMPNGKGPFPAAILVAGSGPNDEDETIGPNKTFKDLAWGLASHGIAVLRYPKRTHVYGARSSADPQAMTVKEEYIDDARAAVALLASQRAIDPKHVFVIGHSEGGYLAPRIAAGDPQVAGIVILEGNTRSIGAVLLDQLRYLSGLPGPDAAAIQKMAPEVRAQVAAMDAEGLEPGVELKLLSSTIQSSYVLDLRQYDPGAAAARLTIPIYVAQGGRDYQVTAADFAGWQRALAGHSNATFKQYPPLDHLLIAGEGLSTPAQYGQPGRHVSADLVQDLIAWISRR